MLPLGVAEADLALEGPIIVALSGGGDSTALVHLLAPRGDVRAVIVDHGLRAGSAEEAALVAAHAEAIGVTPRVVRLSWRDDEKRTQASMRAKRYAALCAAAREAGARVIALGHTMDDQAETLALRAEAGSGWRGLAGMAPLAPAPIWPEGAGLVVARPLLNARRADLRAWLVQRRIDWIEDPSNENEVFARVRVRRALAGSDPARAARLAALLRMRAERLDRAAAEWLARALSFEPVQLDLTVCAPAHVRVRGLEALIAAAGGTGRTPSAAAVRRLLMEIEAPGFAGATLGGCHLRTLPLEGGGQGGGEVVGRDSASACATTHSAVVAVPPRPPAPSPSRGGGVSVEPETGLRRRGLPRKKLREAPEIAPEAIWARLSHILFTPL